MPGRGSNLANSINKAEGLLKKRPKEGSSQRRQWGHDLAKYVKEIANSPMGDELLIARIQSPTLLDYVRKERNPRRL